MHQSKYSLSCLAGSLPLHPLPPTGQRQRGRAWHFELLNCSSRTQPQPLVAPTAVDWPTLPRIALESKSKSKPKSMANCKSKLPVNLATMAARAACLARCGIIEVPHGSCIHTWLLLLYLSRSVCLPACLWHLQFKMLSVL